MDQVMGNRKIDHLWVVGAHGQYCSTCMAVRGAATEGQQCPGTAEQQLIEKLWDIIAPLDFAETDEAKKLLQQYIRDRR